MITGEKINWIEGTPLGVNIREIEYIAPHVHNDIVEITLCLSGEIALRNLHSAPVILYL